MKYVILVSHGQLAAGFYSALSMLAGKDRTDILYQGLEDGMSVDKFGEKFQALIENVSTEDEIILFADILGGSPLTTALNVLADKGMLSRTFALGGMNLPSVLTGILMKDSMNMEDLKKTLLQESVESIKEFALPDADLEHEEDI